MVFLDPFCTKLPVVRVDHFPREIGPRQAETLFKQPYITAVHLLSYRSRPADVERPLLITLSTRQSAEELVELFDAKYICQSSDNQFRFELETDSLSPLLRRWKIGVRRFKAEDGEDKEKFYHDLTLLGPGVVPGRNRERWSPPPRSSRRSRSPPIRSYSDTPPHRPPPRGPRHRSPSRRNSNESRPPPSQYSPGRYRRDSRSPPPRYRSSSRSTDRRRSRSPARRESHRRTSQRSPSSVSHSSHGRRHDEGTPEDRREARRRHRDPTRSSLSPLQAKALASNSGERSDAMDVDKSIPIADSLTNASSGTEPIRSDAAESPALESTQPPSAANLAFQQQLSEAENQNLVLQQRILELEQRNAGLEKDKVDLEASVEGVKQEKKSLEESTKDLQQRSDSLRDELSSFQLQHNSAQEEKKSLEESTKDLQQRNDSLRDELSSLQLQHDSAQIHRTLLQDQERRILELEQTLASLRQQTSTLQPQNTQLQTENASLQAQIAALRARAVEFDRIGGEFERQRSELLAQTSEVQVQNTTLQTQRHNLESQITDLQNALRDRTHVASSTSQPQIPVDFTDQLVEHGFHQHNAQLQSLLTHALDRCCALEKRLEQKSKLLDEELVKAQSVCALSKAYQLLDQITSGAVTVYAVPGFVR